MQTGFQPVHADGVKIVLQFDINVAEFARIQLFFLPARLNSGEFSYGN